MALSSNLSDWFPALQSLLSRFYGTRTIPSRKNSGFYNFQFAKFQKLLQELAILTPETPFWNAIPALLYCRVTAFLYWRRFQVWFIHNCWYVKTFHFTISDTPEFRMNEYRINEVLVYFITVSVICAPSIWLSLCNLYLIIVWWSLPLMFVLNVLFSVCDFELTTVY